MQFFQSNANLKLLSSEINVCNQVNSIFTEISTAFPLTKYFILEMLLYNFGLILNSGKELSSYLTFQSVLELRIRVAVQPFIFTIKIPKPSYLIDLNQFWNTCCTSLYKNPSAMQTRFTGSRVFGNIFECPSEPQWYCKLLPILENNGQLFYSWIWLIFSSSPGTYFISICSVKELLLRKCQHCKANVHKWNYWALQENVKMRS